MTEAYIHQTIHTLDGNVRHLDAHIAAADEASRALFGRAFRPDTAALAARIGATLAAERPPHDRSAFVRLLLAPCGEATLRFAGVSLYRGYDLRTVRPEAVSLVYDLPLGEYPTSAQEAADALAAARAAALGARCAVRCDSGGFVRAADGAPLFAAAGHRAVTPPGPRSAAATAAAAAIEAAGMTLEVRPLRREELTAFEELFYFDHRGVTSLSRCDGALLMDIAAARVAHAAAAGNFGE